MLKLEFAEWIRQNLFPVQAFEVAGNASLYYREGGSAPLRVGNTFSQAVIDLWTETVRWRRALLAAAAMRACNDRTLRDIGIDRLEIASIIYFGGQGRRRGPIDFD